MGRYRVRYQLERVKKPMATQVQPTPTVTGEYAKAILEEMKRKPTPEQEKEIENLRKFFQQVPKRGLR